MATPPIIDQLTNLSSESSVVAKINANLNKLSTAFGGLLSSNTTPGNTMSVALDMNSNRILNLPYPGSFSEPTRLKEFQDFQSYIISLIASAQAGGVVIPVPGTGTSTQTSVVLDDFAVTGQTTWDAAFAAAVLALPYGGIIGLSKSNQNYVFTSLNIPSNIYLRGKYLAPPFPGTNQALNLNGLQFIRLKTGGTVSLGAGSGITGCVIAPEGMSFPQPNSSAWAGTAITVNGDQTLIDNCLVLGFAQAHVSAARGRGIINNLFLDCNSGLSFTNSYDTTRVYGIHAWPFATIQAYAASLNTLPTGDPNRTVDGYDARINVRSGTGMKFRNSNDDTYVDSAIMVGFLTGYDLESTGGIHFGRIWSECYARSGSIGFRAGPNVTNVYVDDAQIWSSGACVLMAMNASEHIVFGNLRCINPLFAPITISGGNLSFDTCICVGVPDASSCINIVAGNGAGTLSQVAGTIWNESFTSTSPVVLVPVGFIHSNLDMLKIRSNQPAGTTRIGGNISYPQYLTAAQTVLLPINGDMFKITGSTQIEKFGGGSVGRRITILFTAATPVAYTGVAGGGIAGSVQGVASRTFAAGGIMELYYDVEYGSWREMFFKDNSTPGGGTSTTAVTNIRMVYVADVGGSTMYGSSPNGVGNTYEPYPGAVVTGHGANSSGLLYSSRFRYLQYMVNGTWNTAGLSS